MDDKFVTKKTFQDNFEIGSIENNPRQMQFRYYDSCDAD